MVTACSLDSSAARRPRWDRERSAQAGFDAHLVKPVEIDHLDEVIAQFESP